MIKILIRLFVLVIFVLVIFNFTLVLASNNLVNKYNNWIKLTAWSLHDNESIYNTVENIDNYIKSNFEYKIYFFPRDPAWYWYDKRGDCSDRAIMKQNMLNELNITNRIVFGYSNDFGMFYNGFHTWVEYIDETGLWGTQERGRFKHLRKLNIGIR